MAALSKARVFWIRWCSLWAFFWAAFGIFTPVGWIGVPFSLLAILIPVGLNRSRPAAIAFGGPAQATGTPPGGTPTLSKPGPSGGGTAGNGRPTLRWAHLEPLDTHRPTFRLSCYRFRATSRAARKGPPMPRSEERRVGKECRSRPPGGR